MVSHRSGAESLRCQPRGGVAERSNAAVSKTVIRLNGGSRVQIPPPPLNQARNSVVMRLAVTPGVVTEAITTSARDRLNPLTRDGVWRASGARFPLRRQLNSGAPSHRWRSPAAYAD